LTLNKGWKKGHTNCCQGHEARAEKSDFFTSNRTGTLQNSTANQPNATTRRASTSLSQDSHLWR